MVPDAAAAPASTDARGPLKSWQQEALELAAAMSKGDEPFVLIRPREHIRGHHPHFIILDDIVGPPPTPEQSARAVEWYEQAIARREPDPAAGSGRARPPIAASKRTPAGE